MLYDPILENLFKDFPDKQNEMIKWINNYSAEKSKNHDEHSNKSNKEPSNDEWRKKRNSIFVSEISPNRNNFIENLIPSDVFYYIIFECISKDFL